MMLFLFGFVVGIAWFAIGAAMVYEELTTAFPPKEPHPWNRFVRIALLTVAALIWPVMVIEIVCEAIRTRRTR